MAEIRRRTLDTHFEDQITMAMVMSTKFLTEIRPLYSPDYMKNTFARIVCYWCVDYFDHYKKAPEFHIKDIFVVESESGMAKEDSEIIKEFLTRLSRQYAEGQKINEDLIKDYAFSYFRKRDLEIRSEKTRKLLEVDKVEEAEEQFLKFKKVAFQTSGWINPFDSKEILQVFDEDEKGIFTFPGALGELVGPVERGWFIGVLGVFKRGKSFCLQEIAVRALFQHLKIVFVSLEMKAKNVKERFYKRLTAYGSRSGEDVFLYPTFDCKRNQDGSCTRAERTNLLKLLDTDGAKPEYDINSDYRPCTYCRDNRIRDYLIDSWFEPLDVPKFAFTDTKKHIQALGTMYGENIRFICYPRLTAGVNEIQRDIFSLEQYEGFIPDMILVDYADILKPPPNKDKRNQIDDIWVQLAAMGAERHAIVVTASQGTRGAIYKSDVAQDDLAEWIGKLGHVDIFLGLNQTPQDKEAKVIRINLLAHRHKEVDESVFATILQQLEVGQFFLDSEIKFKQRRLS